MEYITRLTPNSDKWKKPSGKKGKCCSNNSTLYECQHDFGWEEWLLNDFWSKKERFKGFVQAFNDRNTNVKSIERLHFYTRVCNSRTSKVNVYLGYIDNVNIFPIKDRALSKNEIKTRGTELKKCGLVIPKDGMFNKAHNIQFNTSDVHMLLMDEDEQYTLNLAQGQYRFALYEINYKHKNIGNQIKRFKCTVKN